MQLREVISNFCNQYMEYTYVTDDPGKRMNGEKCCGIRILQGHSYMEMFIRLTEYLERVEYEDTALELSNPVIDEVGDDTMVYFPYVCSE